MDGKEPKMSGRAQLGPTAGGTPALSPEARALYLEIVRAGGRVSSESRCHQPNTLTELLEIGLLMPDADERSDLVAVDPAQLSARLSGTWQRQALDLLSRAVSLPVELQELSQEFHAPEKSSGAIEYVQGKVLINQRIDQLMAAGVEEALALQPGGPRPPELLASMIERDLDALNSGTAMRTIYHASTRYHQPTRDYVARLAKAGGQFRTLDEPYTRLIVINRRAAVIPVADDMTLAAFIFEPVIANYLAEEVFEPSWNRALEFDGNRAVPQQVVSRLRQTIIDLLLAGINHRVIARRLGISERTLARHIAEMREDYNVESLFQLGYALARASEHS
ncbi:helix-turn-helix domain-containing protein [Kitasatospora xanthocidica]|uniref:Helix-turn-helix domain-containing protein n=1 Tax=Kitasatospora xanthocidica TaxID=83382 RepID=A0A372ZZ86_9ACTN|nr:helix-turn-helix domain-containing protein [Kitasatospora xanthocidica]RGD60525.1 helix-turn-helix domain-containing protein [Kitasatospora xanthocidica]